MADWPPTLAQLKLDSDLVGDDRSDEQLQQCLDAAVAYVERVHSGELWVYDDDLVLGTLRLARRWDARRQSLDGLVVQGEVSSTIPSFDSDLEKLLRVGRYAPPRFA